MMMPSRARTSKEAFEVAARQESVPALRCLLRCLLRSQLYQSIFFLYPSKLYLYVQDDPSGYCNTPLRKSLALITLAIFILATCRAYNLRPRTWTMKDQFDAVAENGLLTKVLSFLF